MHVIKDMRLTKLSWSLDSCTSESHCRRWAGNSCSVQIAVPLNTKYDYSQLSSSDFCIIL